jgi:hypothetical protein
VTYTLSVELSPEGMRMKEFLAREFRPWWHLLTPADRGRLRISDLDFPTDGTRAVECSNELIYGPMLRSRRRFIGFNMPGADNTKSRHYAWAVLRWAALRAGRKTPTSRSEASAVDFDVSTRLHGL